MVKLTCLAIRCLAFALCGMVAHAQDISPKMTGQKFQLVVHGGAGTVERSTMTPEKEQEYRAGLENALRAGREVLQGGGSSLDAIEAAVRVLEDDPHFNGSKKFIISDLERHGTVGAVARDAQGNLAAATSTGGINNKLPGRVGDSPVIGAGTYADNATCAVSCTGDGEFFIRAAVAHQVSALMELRGMSLSEAAERALAHAEKLGGTGGLIAVDKNGNVALPFNTSGMYRGHVREDGKLVIGIYK